MLRYSLPFLLALPVAVSADARVAVLGDSLADARALYASSTDRPRRDCDPVSGGRWVCASFEDPVLGDVEVAEPGTGPSPVPPSSSSAPPTVGAAVVGDSLDAAKRAYAQVTSQPRADCDPVPDGRWVCASFENPTLADVGDATPIAAPPAPVDEPVPAAPPVPPEPKGTASLKLQAEDLPLGAGWSVERERAGYEGDGYAIWRGPNRYRSPGDGLTNLQFEVPAAGEYQLVIRARAVSPDRGDLSNDSWFRFPDGEWTKVFTTGRDDWQVGGTGDRDDRKFPFRSRLEAGVVTVQLSGRSERHALDWIALERVGGGGGDAAPEPVAKGALGPNDLLALHYDSAPDPDDTMAMIFARLILNDYPDIDPIVLNGTLGDKVGRGAFIRGSTEHLRTMFPDALDYFADRERTVERSATAWQLTLEAGGTVHVAAGGPMDASADILRELERRGVGNLKRVRVVQHSHGDNFNERLTSDDGMAFIRSRATYVTIDNGNANGNATPDFNETSASVMRRALESRYASQWRRARSFFPSNGQNKIDGSDTVELMHILGLPKSHAPTVEAFADRYFR